MFMERREGEKKCDFVGKEEREKNNFWWGIGVRVGRVERGKEEKRKKKNTTGSNSKILT
jgi:hypothetical protein